MKLRIYQNSIRFRVQIPEITALKGSGRIDASVRLGPGKEDILEYSVELSQADSPEIIYSAGVIRLLIPEKAGLQWANTNEVGIYASQGFNDGETLKILLEKDFKCLDDTFEDQSDMFPNPKSTC